MTKNKLILNVWNPSVRKIDGINKNVLIMPYKEGGKIKYRIKIPPEERKQTETEQFNFLWIDESDGLFVTPNIIEGYDLNVEVGEDEFKSISLEGPDENAASMLILTNGMIQFNVNNTEKEMSVSEAFRKLEGLSKTRPELYTPNVVNGFKDAYNKIRIGDYFQIE